MANRECISVSKTKSFGTFKKKIYHLGRFEKDKKNDAIKIRKEAEKKLFGEFLEWYESIKNKEL